MFKRKEWIEVVYPRRHHLGLLFLYLIFVFINTSLIGKANGLLSVILLLMSIYMHYKLVKVYMKRNKSKSKMIERQIQYMIHTLNLYDEEYVEVTKNNKASMEKKICRVIRIYYKLDHRKVYVRVYRDGDRFTKISSSKEFYESLEAALGMELEKAIKNIRYIEFSFLRYKDKRINVSTGTKLSQGTKVMITESLSYDVSKVSHGLTVGSTGSGKSFFINSKILAYAQMSDKKYNSWDGADIRICDPKASDLYLYKFVTGFGPEKVACEPNLIAKMIREVSELVEKRYREMFNDISSFGKTFVDFRGYPPVVIFIDEYAALMKTVDKKNKEEIEKHLYNIVLKGRGCGVFAEIILQRPDASIIPGQIRDQLQVRTGLSNLSQEGKQMLFGSTDIEYKTVNVKGGGYIFIDSVTEQPVYFETPFISKDFDFLDEIDKIYKKRLGIN
ncbi:FtsK/SpoIIIE domain-containing protein [Vagococcus zengguangii]|uniref:Cell division protein FtsK n=1 Tax=Vagococcus zengguangii TaxID=2571750 RepID=A0A4D7CN56_9ENTE|nr:FtsK/SpoIIIE domain-containing protein [Vagococcus zengguangii]QCI85539.1 cell division protein FtsK [Vagococcus zengguangii]TLG80085.1 cell division protein FtsK [Vagococcus zengguangii]